MKTLSKYEQTRNIIIPTLNENSISASRQASSTFEKRHAGYNYAERVSKAKEKVLSLR
jgi:hypothetical protein